MIIDVKCAKCEHEQEILIKRAELLEDDSVICHECIKCESRELKRIFSAPNTTFKLNGTGWFKDGY